jgi:hypothetical protein
VALRTKLPAGAITRRCEACPKTFRPMTEREWRNVRVIHEAGDKHKARSSAGASPVSSVPSQP